MVGFRRVEISEGPVAAGEGGGGHVSSVEDVFLLDFVVVEEGLETDGVEKADDAGVSGHEWARRHVAAEDGGVVFAHSGFEELDFAAFGVEVFEAVFDRAEE